MIHIGYFSNVWAAVTRRAPTAKAKKDPYFFGMQNGFGTGRSTPKTTMNMSKLRSFSESPVPRRAISYIKDQISMLDWDIVMLDGSQPNPKQRAEIAMLKYMFHHPNPDDTWRSFLEQFAEDLLVIGAGSVEKVPWPNNPEQQLALYLVDAASIEIFQQWNGDPKKPRYAQRDAKGDYVTFTTGELMYTRMNPRTNTPFGLSPLEVAAQNIEYFLDAQAKAGRATSLATPDRALDLGEEVTTDHLREYRIYWQDEVEGRGRQPIIGGTKNAKSIQLAATDDNGLFLKWQSFLIVQIANAFGVDPMKFGALIGTTHANANVLDDSTDESAIRPLAHTIQQAINRDILSFLGYDKYEFVFRWTSSFEDRKSLAAIDQIYLQMNVLQLDEARAHIGKPPLPDGKGAMTLAEHNARYGGNNHVLGPDVDYDAGDGKYGDNGSVPAQIVKNQALQVQNPAHNPNAMNQMNKSAQTPKIQTRSNTPLNQGRNNLKI